MTSTHEIELAQEIIENDKSKAVPLIKLLFRFRASRGDPLGEAMMSTVLKTLYLETEHCEAALADFVGADETKTSLLAAH